MKTSLKLITLLVAAGYPCVALAGFAGLTVSSSASASLLGGFVAAGVALLFLGDYSGRRRLFPLTRATLIVPPPGAFRSQADAKPERLAA